MYFDQIERYSRYNIMHVYYIDSLYHEPRPYSNQRETCITEKLKVKLN